MKRIVLAAVIAVLLALPTLSFGGGSITQITLYDSPDNSFVPKNAPTRDLGTGSFHWSRDVASFNDHNVRQDDKLFRSGEVTSGPIDFQLTVSAGTFHYYCENHGSRTSGMEGTVKVRPSLVPDPIGRPFTIVWADINTESGNAFDVRYKRGGGTWKIWRNDTSAFSAVFGRHKHPERIQLGSTYKFQARSEKKSNPSKRSKWSPTLTVST
jgi:hypothetical protein